jgi:hypothetical protein
MCGRPRRGAPAYLAPPAHSRLDSRCSACHRLRLTATDPSQMEVRGRRRIPTELSCVNTAPFQGEKRTGHHRENADQIGLVTNKSMNLDTQGELVKG